MTKAEKTALKLVSELLAFAQSAEISDNKSEFTRGMAAAYHNAAQMITWKLRSDAFSE